MRSVLNKNKRFEFIMFVPQIIMVLSKVGNNDGLYVQKGRVCHFIIIIIQQKIRFCSTTYSAKQVSCCDFTMESFSYEVLLFSRISGSILGPRVAANYPSLRGMVCNHER